MIIAFMIGGLLCGSFLNFVGHRLLSGQSLRCSRSQCPSCFAIIAWYDLIPLVSYFVLRQRCRQCHSIISWLYPFIELFGLIAGIALWFDLCAVGASTQCELIGRGVAHGLLLSGFIVATRTDLEALVVPRIVIILLGCVGVVAAMLGVLPVTVAASMIGAVVGYGSLWLLNYASRCLLGRDGIGEGDMELLFVIGLFWGPVGVWAITFMSSVIGIVVAVAYLLLTDQGRDTRIPFIPFMATSVIGYLFLQTHIMDFLF